MRVCAAQKKSDFVALFISQFPIFIHYLRCNFISCCNLFPFGWLRNKKAAGARLHSHHFSFALIDFWCWNITSSFSLILYFLVDLSFFEYLLLVILLLWLLFLYVKEWMKFICSDYAPARQDAWWEHWKLSIKLQIGRKLLLMMEIDF